MTERAHADWCPGDCPQWIAAGASSCLPYPCQCAATRIDTKERYPWSDGACWWRAKLSGKIKSRCPCWGRDRAGMPGDCCAHHSANPLYAATTTVGIEQAGAVADEPPPPPEYDELPTDVDDILDIWLHDAPARKEFVRRWPPEALTCPCTLTFAKTSAAVHCVNDDCHQNFANPATFSIHRRDWTKPCRPPWSIVDVDTGRSLLAQDGAGIWRDSYPG